MPSAVLKSPDVFPVGTSVGAYALSGWPTGQLPVAPGSAPVGSAVETQTVAADGSLTFTTLTAGVDYVAAAQVNTVWKYVHFRIGTGEPIVRAQLVENVNTVAASGAALTLPDVTVDTMHLVTLTANCVLTFPGPGAGRSFLLALKQDATGTRTVTWPGTVKWPGGTAPTLTTTAGKTDLLSFTSVDGASWLGILAAANF